MILVTMMTGCYLLASAIGYFGFVFYILGRNFLLPFWLYQILVISTNSLTSLSLMGFGLLLSFDLVDVISSRPPVCPSVI